MLYNVYSIHDLLTGYMNPALDINDVSATRNFEHACMQVGSLFNTHASDYELIKLGQFDSETGEFLQSDKKIVACGRDFVLDK